MLIIREEWPKYYFELAKNPFLFNDSSSFKTREKLLKDDNNKGIEAFLNSTQAISNDIDYKIFEKIISNNKSELSQKVINAINEVRIDQIDEFIKNNQVERNEIIEFSISNLQTGIKGSRYGTLVHNSFSLLLLLNAQDELDQSYNNRIENIIINHLSAFIRSLNISMLVFYLKNLERNNKKYLLDEIMQILHLEFDNKKDSYDDFNSTLFQNIIKSFTDKSILDKLKFAFTNYYKTNKIKIEELQLDAKQLNSIIEDELLNFIIDKIENKDFDIKELIYISKNKEISDLMICTVFKRINIIYERFENPTEIITLLNLIIPFLKTIKIGSLEITDLELINDKIFTFNINEIEFLSIDGIINDPERVYIILEYLKYVYLTTTYIEKVRQKFDFIVKSKEVNAELVYEILLEMKDEDDLIFLNDIILNGQNYSPKLITLLEFILTGELDENRIKTKIEEICQTLFSREDLRESLNLLLEKLVLNEVCKRYFIEIGSQKVANEISSLSLNLQSLLFDRICENITEYEKNIELMIIIAKNGNEQHLSKLANVILRKLTDEQTFTEALDILESSGKLTKQDKTPIVSQLRKIEKNEIYSERAKKSIDNLGK